jgi:putative acetyltransferase
VKITAAQSPDEIEEVRRLFWEYETFLGEDLSFQGFEDELATLPGKYGPPTGALFIAVNGEETAGCVALRKLEHAVCEMKRLFVRPQFRGRGLGRELAARIVDEAIRLGYSVMLLDTLDRLDRAMMLYESLGFVRTEPYYHNPLPGVVYWKLDLGGQPSGLQPAKGDDGSIVRLSEEKTH